MNRIHISRTVVLLLSACLFIRCGNNESLFVDCITSPIELSIENIIEANCGVSDGSFTVIATGGNGEYQFTLNNAITQATGDFSNLSAGEHEVMVIDIGGCEALFFIALTDNGNVSIEGVSSTNADCGVANGSISVNATGGSGNLSYSVDNSNFQPNSIIINLTSGIYTVTTKDVDGCIATSSVEVLENDGITIDNVETMDSGCNTNNGSLTVIASGAGDSFTYSLNGGAPQNSGAFSNLSNDTYLITIKDNRGCVKTTNVIINSGVSYQQSISNIISSNCAITGCHVSGGIRADFTQFSNVQSRASQIKSRTQSGNMPKTGSLSQQQIDLIACWVDDGALNN